MKTTNDLLQELGAERGWLVIADDRVWILNDDDVGCLETISGTCHLYTTRTFPYEIIAVLKPVRTFTIDRETLAFRRISQICTTRSYETVYHIDIDGKPDTSEVQKRIEAAEKELAEAKKMLKGAV